MGKRPLDVTKYRKGLVISHMTVTHEILSNVTKNRKVL